ncbi:hypothetical protein [Chitinibacter sp. ZOR0017]|uniref:hypothetical protein n=1 Tax=Chitinibacter sp. ZOR0017 TaxID=1339254 RepID=UPI0006479084|nr:hypothetical protein [Chitinibacter sp. ZOR0017]
MSKSITTRTGKTVVVDPMTASRHDLVAVGFASAEADAMVRMRRVLPFDPDSKTPKYDARKLWERIGKPYRQFNKWAEQYIKPLLESFGQNSPKVPAESFGQKSPKVREVVDFLIPTKGRPQVGYLLSRDVAADLAMQVRTPKGDTVRAYFRAMERAFYGLQVRGEHRNLTDEDKALYQFLLEKAEYDKPKALSWERDIKNRVAEILSGLTASAWRDLLGCGRGIRDVLFTDDLAIYDRAYSAFIAAIQMPHQTRDSAAAVIARNYGGRIKPSRYGLAGGYMEPYTSMEF